MTIKQQGGIFGRNPTFNDIDAASVDINSGATGGSPLTLTTTASGHNIDMIDSTSTARIRNVGGRLHITADVNDEAASSAIRFYVDNTRMVDINDSGNIVFNSAGQGIDFSATSGTGTSELFDDYEEGSFSPVISDNSSGGNTASITVVGAKYIKIGKIVHLYARINNINTAGMTSGNAVSIQGLPFASGVDVFSCGSCVLDRIGAGGDTTINPKIDESLSIMQFAVTSSASGTSDANLLVSQIGSTGSDIHSLQITYEAS